jgi:hypothetical protein
MRFGLSVPAIVFPDFILAPPAFAAAESPLRSQLKRPARERAGRNQRGL